MFTKYLLIGLLAFPLVFSFIRMLPEAIRYAKICGF